MREYAVADPQKQPWDTSFVIFLTICPQGCIVQDTAADCKPFLQVFRRFLRFFRLGFLLWQRGGGMCTTKSTPEREKACITFLKWLTSPERNVEFVTILGYMPVTQEAFDAYLPAAVEQLSNPMYVSLYETYLKMQESYTFYYAPQMENYLDLETRFENLSRLKLMAGRAQYQEGSGTAEELVWDTLDSFKLDYGT